MSHLGRSGTLLDPPNTLVSIPTRYTDHAKLQTANCRQEPLSIQP